MKELRGWGGGVLVLFAVKNCLRTFFWKQTNKIRSSWWKRCQGRRFGLLTRLISVTRLCPSVHMWLWLEGVLCGLFESDDPKCLKAILNQEWGNLLPLSVYFTCSSLPVLKSPNMVIELLWILLNMCGIHTSAASAIIKFHTFSLFFFFEGFRWKSL